MNKNKLLFFILMTHFCSASFALNIEEIAAKNKKLEEITEHLDTMLTSFYDSAVNFEKHPDLEALNAEILAKLQEQRHIVTELIIKNRETKEAIKNYKK